MNTVVCALYHFVRIDDPHELRRSLVDVMEANGVRGTLILAHEGINGTVAGTRDGIDALLDHLKRDPRFAALSHKESFDEEMPFLRARVKLKKEIVTMGIDAIDPGKIVGTYVKPKDWNTLIEDPDVTLIDSRNDYEVRIGTFRNAINPHTTSFRQFPDYVADHLDPAKHRKVAMFCTGGIRCEKSTAYLKELGFDQVFHLEGGILKYLEEVPRDESLWEGECFVFDNRVTVNHDLKRGRYEQCHACRMPIDEQDKRSNAYVAGVSCPHCIETLTDERRTCLLERERQVRLAGERGEAHIGSDGAAVQQRRKAEKAARKEAHRRHTVPARDVMHSDPSPASSGKSG